MGKIDIAACSFIKDRHCPEGADRLMLKDAEHKLMDLVARDCIVKTVEQVYRCVRSGMLVFEKERDDAGFLNHGFIYQGERITLRLKVVKKENYDS